MIVTASPDKPLGWRRSAPKEAPVGDPAKPVAPDLDETMSRVASGDRDAFAELYDAFAGPIHGTTLRILRSPEHAEEVTQEIFLEVWEKADRWERSRGSAAAWMLVIARRRAVDCVRREQAARDRAEKVGPTWLAASADEVSEEVITRQEHVDLRSRLDVLTPLQRQAIELAYFTGKTYREVAEALDVPLGTVKSRMRDGLLRLREAFGASR